MIESFNRDSDSQGPYSQKVLDLVVLYNRTEFKPKIWLRSPFREYDAQFSEN